MPKLCGRNEKCFVEGSDVWGHLGGILCLHLIECADHSSSCAMDGSVSNHLYTNEAEYQTIIKKSGSGSGLEFS